MRPQDHSQPLTGDTFLSAPSGAFQQSSLITAMPPANRTVPDGKGDQFKVGQEIILPSKLALGQITPEGEIRFKIAVPAGELTLTRLLGDGAYGSVYEGLWNDQLVAIKKFKSQSLTEQAIKELRQEAQIMFQLGTESKYIVPLKKICLESPHYSLVMELMPKGSLYQLLHNGQDLPWSIRFQIALDTAWGLKDLHAYSILHRDLKSLNILLDDRLRAKLADFGLAKVKYESSSQPSVSKSKVGTLLWMAPELFADEPQITRASDIYSFGMVLWELASRLIPYSKWRPEAAGVRIAQGKKEEIPNDCPKGLEALIKCCWDLEPSKRPTAIQVMESLKFLVTTTDKELKKSESASLALIKTTEPSLLVDTGVEQDSQLDKKLDRTKKIVPKVEERLLKNPLSRNQQTLIPAPKSVVDTKQSEEKEITNKLSKSSDGSGKHRCKECDIRREIKFERDLEGGGIHDYYTIESGFEINGERFRISQNRWAVAHINTGGGSIFGYLNPIGHSVICVEGIELVKSSLNNGLYSPLAVYFVRYYQLTYSDDNEEQKNNIYKVYSKQFDHHHWRESYHSIKVWPKCKSEDVRKMMAAIEQDQKSGVPYDIRGDRELYVRRKKIAPSMHSSIGKANRILLLSNEKQLPTAKDQWDPTVIYLHIIPQENYDKYIAYWWEEKVCKKELEASHSLKLKDEGMPTSRRVLHSQLELVNEKLINLLKNMCGYYVEKDNCTSWAIKCLKIAGIDEPITLLDKFFIKPKNHTRDDIPGSSGSCLIM
ncbi:MAG: protein kinase [Proteobacteria bacterium]|nr:protein kinase [Pseudomonadota bacterium]